MKTLQGAQPRKEKFTTHIRGGRDVPRSNLERCWPSPRNTGHFVARGEMINGLIFFKEGMIESYALEWSTWTKNQNKEIFLSLKIGALRTHRERKEEQYEFRPDKALREEEEKERRLGTGRGRGARRKRR